MVYAIILTLLTSTLLSASEASNSTSASVDTPKSEIIARRAILAAIGQNNEYLERLLSRSMGHEVEKPKTKTDRKVLKKELEHKKTEAEKIVSTLASTPDDVESQLPARERIAACDWIITNVLQEKLKDRESSEKDKKIKYATVIGAVAVQVVVGLTQYYITHTLCDGSN